MRFGNSHAYTAIICATLAGFGGWGVAAIGTVVPNAKGSDYLSFLGSFVGVSGAFGAAWAGIELQRRNEWRRRRYQARGIGMAFLDLQRSAEGEVHVKMDKVIAAEKTQTIIENGRKTLEFAHDLSIGNFSIWNKLRDVSRSLGEIEQKLPGAKIIRHARTDSGSRAVLKATADYLPLLENLALACARTVEVISTEFHLGLTDLE